MSPSLRLVQDGTTEFTSVSVEETMKALWLAVLVLIMAPSSVNKGALPSDDESTIAGLDTEYQAAVKRNDAATMARILADDFVLVTGKGHIYTKADLLKEANDKNVIYEHQEDSNQKVRIWGNTAVVTA